MRVGILVVGIVLAILGFLLIFSFIGFVLVTIGVIVAIVGAVLPEAPRTAATPELLRRCGAARLEWLTA